MKPHRIAILLLAPPLMLPAGHEKPDWQAVERIPVGTHILVTTNRGTYCAFQGATEDTLSCTTNYPGLHYHGLHPDYEFSRANVRDVCVGEMQFCSAFDASEGNPFLLAALQAGGGWSNGFAPNAFAGAKLGIGGLTLDLQYDRLKSGTGFSTEGSWMMPILRVPTYRKGNDRLFFRAYAEPGFGYRAGGGTFGQYASAKALVIIGHKWVDGGASPYFEVQRRFPFGSPLNGENRIAVGIMVAVCEHCGLD